MHLSINKNQSLDCKDINYLGELFIFFLINCSIMGKDIIRNPPSKLIIAKEIVSIPFNNNLPTINLRVQLMLRLL